MQVRHATIPASMLACIGIGFLLGDWAQMNVLSSRTLPKLGTSTTDLIERAATRTEQALKGYKKTAWQSDDDGQVMQAVFAIRRFAVGSTPAELNDIADVIIDALRQEILQVYPPSDFDVSLGSEYEWGEMSAVVAVLENRHMTISSVLTGKAIPQLAKEPSTENSGAVFYALSELMATEKLLNDALNSLCSTDF